jgi:hypothetical protein
MAAVWWGRPRRRAANIGVMSARRDGVDDVAPCIVKHRRDNGDIGQVRAAVVGVVHHEHITRSDCSCILSQRGAHTVGHGPKVDRHMRRIRHQIAMCVENGTGKIVAFFDVHRIGRVGQSRTHLFGDGHIKVVEHLKHHRINSRSNRFGAHERHGAAQDQIATLHTFRLPAVFQHIGSSWFRQDRGTVNGVARGHCRSVHQRHVDPCASAEHAGGLVGSDATLGLGQCHALAC